MTDTERIKELESKLEAVEKRSLSVRRRHLEEKQLEFRRNGFAETLYHEVRKAHEDGDQEAIKNALEKYHQDREAWKTEARKTLAENNFSAAGISE